MRSSLFVLRGLWGLFSRVLRRGSTVQTVAARERADLISGRSVAPHGVARAPSLLTRHISRSPCTSASKSSATRQDRNTHFPICPARTTTARAVAPPPPAPARGSLPRSHAARPVRHTLSHARNKVARWAGGSQASRASMRSARCVPPALPPLAKHCTLTPCSCTRADHGGRQDQDWIRWCPCALSRFRPALFRGQPR